MKYIMMAVSICTASSYVHFISSLQSIRFLKGTKALHLSDMISRKLSNIKEKRQRHLERSEHILKRVGEKMILWHYILALYELILMKDILALFCSGESESI